MTRMDYPDPNNMPPAVQAMLDARPPRNIFRMLAHAPALLPGIMELTGAILYRAKLDPVSRELAVLRVGHLCGSHYEVGQHRKIARAIGLPQEKIDAALQDDIDFSIYAEKEALVLRMAEEVVRNVKAGDALFAATLAAFGPEQTMELLLMENQEMTQAFSPHASQKAFTNGIRSRRPVRRSKDFDATRAKFGPNLRSLSRIK